MLWAKQSQLMELLLKLAYCQLMQTSHHRFGNWEKKMIHQTPKALPLPCFIFKPKQPYSFCISFPGFHCRLCSAHLLFLCWGKMQSKKVVMNLMVSSCCSFMLHTDLPLLLCALWCPTPYEGHLCSLRAVTVLVWVALAWVATLPQGYLCHSTSRRSPIGMEPLRPRAHLWPHVPSAVSLCESLKPCPGASPVPAGWLFMCAQAGILCAPTTRWRFDVH